VEAGTLQLVCLSCSFWVALAIYGWHAPDAVRMGVGLALGATFAHFGWLILHVDRVATEPLAWVAQPAGFCVLFVPLGPLAAAPWREPIAERTRFLAASFAALPLALATARLGCLAAGCCEGVPTALPWGLPARSGGPPLLHPTALYEIVGLVVLHGFVARAPRPRIAPVFFLVGFGALRLLVDPFRAPPRLGPPLVPARVLALLCCGAGLAGLWPHAASWVRRAWAAPKSASGPTSSGSRA
jgi:hypothetical protein